MSNTEPTAKEPESSSTTTVTAPTTTRVKDPRRVAQGKKLAEISKAAKAAKKKRLQEEAKVHEGGGDSINYSILFGLVGAVVGIGGLFLAYNDSVWKRKPAVTVNENETVKEEKPAVEKKQPTLEGFD